MVGRKTVLFELFTLFQAEEGTQQVAVWAGTFLRDEPRQVGGRLAIQANGRQDAKLLLAEPVLQHRLDQRGLAGPRRRMQEHDSLRDKRFEQLPRLAVAPVETIPATKRPGADIRIAGVRSVHRSYLSSSTTTSETLAPL